MERKLTLFTYFLYERSVISDTDSFKFNFGGELLVGFDNDGKFIGACDGRGDVVELYELGKYKLEKIVE